MRSFKALNHLRPIAWERVLHELARKGVTLRLLWLEYQQEHPDGTVRDQSPEKKFLLKG